jgi:beta-ribofuranosylaminobenzene 5'-phosphate synthase
MQPPSIRVIAPSRLHLGMFSFGQEHVRQFGGIGIMLDRPGTELSFRPATAFDIQGSLAERVKRFAEVWSGNTGQRLPNCSIQVVRAATQHAGLGTGTQLGLAVAAGLNAFSGAMAPPANQLAALVGRGERSAVGTFGFLYGGMLIEAGKYPGENLSPLIARVELPTEWRFVLIQLPESAGLSGVAEKAAFERLSAVSARRTDELCRLALLDLLPAARQEDFAAFSEALYQFGHTAGLCFAELQAGAYATENVAQLVAALRDRGHAGVGQSSWGPTVFVLTADEPAAEELVDWVSHHSQFRGATCEIATVQNHGASVLIEPAGN